EREAARPAGHGAGRRPGRHAGADQLGPRTRRRILPGRGVVIRRGAHGAAAPRRAHRRLRSSEPGAGARVVLPGRRRADRRHVRDQRPGHGARPRRGRGDRGDDRRPANHVGHARPLRAAGARPQPAERDPPARRGAPGRRNPSDHPEV
ncbi:MAG: hypothetical protein AVDCRST_MAG69-1414, partial [uncultured Solirubrobacteraceae bacterium]